MSALQARVGPQAAKGSVAIREGLPKVFTPTPAAARRTLEFFTANIRNPNTRKAYARAVGEFAAWCEGNGLQELGAIEPTHVAGYVEQLKGRLRPLGKFLVPDELDGSQGAYRRPQAQCLLEARTDYAAILAWLRSKHGLTPEQKARLLARRRADVSKTAAWQGPLEWLQAPSNSPTPSVPTARRPSASCSRRSLEKGKPLSSMTQEDCVEYRDFLGDPQPRTWVGAVVTAVATVRGMAFGRRPAPGDHHPRQSVRLPGRPELPDGQPVVERDGAARAGAGQCRAEFYGRAVGLHRSGDPGALEHLGKSAFAATTSESRNPVA